MEKLFPKNIFPYEGKQKMKYPRNWTVSCKRVPNGAAMCIHPPFGMTPTQAIRDLLVWCCRYMQYFMHALFFLLLNSATNKMSWFVKNSQKCMHIASFICIYKDISQFFFFCLLSYGNRFFHTLRYAVGDWYSYFNFSIIYLQGYHP